jgi:hypothetical protein
MNFYYLPLTPYHQNLCAHWGEDTWTQTPTGNFWAWVEKEYGAELTLWERPERWRFKDEQDMVWFALRWA